MKLRYYQEEAVAAVYNHLYAKPTNPCVVLPTGCHAKDHPILMFDGSLKPVQDIVVGDLLMGPDSQPRCVLQLCRGRDEMYRIIPSRGVPFVVNGDHVLSLVCTNEGKKSSPCYRRGGEIENIAVKDYIAKSKSWKHLRKLYRVGVEFNKVVDLPVPPYILGLLIGDGCMRSSVQLTTADDEIADAWTNYAHSLGYETKIAAGSIKGDCATYQISGPRGSDNFLKKVLEEMYLQGQLSGTKFIPNEYLTASRQERLSLLAGLMDSDGHMAHGFFDYITKSFELASDVAFLARSLGYGVFVRKKYGECLQTGAGGWYYRVSVNGDCSQIPCRLKRKQYPKRRQKKDILRTGFSVEKAGEGEYFGFTLDGDHLYVDGHFVVHHNSGKSLTMATICRDAVTKWNGRVLVLAHVKELLEQTAGTLRRLAPDLSVGVYSAGLGSRDTGEPVIVAGIQSVYQKADVLGHFDLVIIDEAHLLPEDGEGMYRTFLQAMKTINPNVRLIGFTATPYRLKSGMICGPDNLLNEICYEVGVKELIARGYLCPLKSRGSEHAVDTSNLHLRGGEFVSDEVETLMGSDLFEQAACREIVQRTKDRKSILVFAASVERAEAVKTLLAKYSGQQCAVVSGDTPSTERDILLKRFKNEPVEANLFGDTCPPLKYLVNVNVLTTGFDAPNIDCVVLLRPTASPGLYYQMVGRSFRLHESKTESLVLDYGNNITRHGPVDAIRIKQPNDSDGKGTAPAKECPKCHQIVHAAVSVCSDCGFEFPKREVNHEREASNEGIISGETTDTVYTVLDIDYGVHRKFGAGNNDPQTVRIDYIIQRGHGYQRSKSEWVCPEHSGWARKKFEDWWSKRSNAPPPDTALDVVEIANSGGLLSASEITVRNVAGEKYDRIIDYKLCETLTTLNTTTCGNCSHYAYGYCCVKHDHIVTRETAACNEFCDVNFDIDEVPF